jgi:hypothetical protein
LRVGTGRLSLVVKDGALTVLESPGELRPPT